MSEEPEVADNSPVADVQSADDPNVYFDELSEEEPAGEASTARTHSSHWIVVVVISIVVAISSSFISVNNTGEGLYSWIPDNTSHWLDVVIISMYLIYEVLLFPEIYENTKRITSELLVKMFSGAAELGPILKYTCILALLAPSVIIINELYLLFIESTEIYHYQYVVCFVILVSALLLLFTDIEYWKTIKNMRNVIFLIVLPCALTLEAIFSTPLGTVRKRGAQYGEMWRSAGILYKCVLVLCYEMVYVLTTYWCLVLLPLLVLRALLYYLTTHVTPVLSPVLNIITWLCDLLIKMSYTARLITWYVATVIYFSSQDIPATLFSQPASLNSDNYTSEGLDMCIPKHNGNSGGGVNLSTSENTLNWLELVVISLNLLFVVVNWIYNYFTRSKNTGTRLSPSDDDAHVSPAQTEVLVTVGDVEKIFRDNSQDYAATTIKRIAVYSTPLSAPFSSSTSSSTVHGYIQRQILPVDYHAFVVLETNDEKFWAVEKMRDGIYVSWGTSLESVLFNFQSEPRPEPVHLLVKDESTTSLGDVVRRLKHVLRDNRYDWVDSQCQHFSKELFDKFAEVKIWDVTSLTDLTSPFKLFSDGGSPLVTLLLSASLICELTLLFFYKSTEIDTYHHYQYVVILVILVSLVVMYYRKSIVTELLAILFILLCCALILEAIFSTPLGTVRKRGAQYGEMMRSAGILYKCLLALSYVRVYVLPTCWYLVFVALVVLLKNGRVIA